MRLRTSSGNDREPNSPETMVTGPRMSASFCRVKFFIRQRINVLFPTFGGPTTTMTMGGGSRGLRSTRGMWCFLVFMSWDLRGKTHQSQAYWIHHVPAVDSRAGGTDLWKVLAMRTADCTANALGLRLRSSSSVASPCFLNFFLSALGPLCFCWCCFCFFTFASILFTERTVTRAQLAP